MKKNYFVILIVLVFGCHLEESIEPKKPETNEIEIVEASNEYKALFSEWSNLNDANARLAREFDANNLVELRNSSLTRWAVVSNVDPSTSLSFVFDGTKNVDNAFISTSIRNTDRSISSRIYTTENKLVMEIVHKPDGSIKIIDRGVPNTLGWWKEFEYCLDKVTNPFESTAANIATGLVFGIATRGLWIPAVGLVCAGVATGRNHQNK